MTAPSATPIADSTKNGSKRVLADVTNQTQNLRVGVAPVTEDVKNENKKFRVNEEKVELAKQFTNTLDTEHDDSVIVISLDGNIGAGKSTLLEAVRNSLPEVEVVVEPVAEWETLKTSDGKSLLQHFYEDKKRWSYTFQNCAILTRLTAIRKSIRETKKRVIITERSLLTDRYVFAEMLKDSGDLNEMEWALYSKWFDNFAVDLPIKGVIHVTTAVDTSADRIQQRGRTGEDGIPREYLAALDAQHYKWLDNTDMPVLRISTERGVSFDKNVEQIRQFIDTTLKANDRAGIFPSPSTENNVNTEQDATIQQQNQKQQVKSAPSPFTMNSVPIETL